MKNRIWVLGILIIMISAVSCVNSSQKKEQWHHPLYMGNNDYWRQRIPVRIMNNTGRELPGDPVELLIGTNPGEVPLTGAIAEAVRVTTSNGDELMFSIIDAEGKQVEKGPVPENCRITMPVECKAGTETVNYIYFDNPSAWAVGDYFRTKTKPSDSISAEVLKTEKISLRERGKNDEWYDDNPGDRYEWQSRIVVRTMNCSPRRISGKVVCVGIEGVLNRLHNEINSNTAIQVTAGNRPVPYFRMGNNILFNQDVPALSEQVNYIYFSSADRSGEKVNIINVTNLSELGKNLIRNPDFESAGLAGWKDIGNMSNIKVSTESKEGAGSAQMQIETGSAEKEAGLEQSVKVQGGKLYLFSSWIKCSDRIEQADFNRTIRERTIRAQFTDISGKNVGRLNRIAVNPDVHIDNEWSQLFMIINVPAGADSVRLQLVNSAPGTVWFDNVLFIEAVNGETSPLAIERKAAKDLDELVVWPEDPIVKVFQDDLPPAEIKEASLSSARNEYEPLQLVIRSPGEYKNIKVKVVPPSDSKGNRLDKVTVGILGYVPVNYPSNYINDRVSPAWRQKIPFGPYGSDGWIGMWPDPVLPFATFDLEPFKTQPVWIELFVPANAVPGDYKGMVQLINNGQTLKEVPFSVHVWDFQLPENSHMAAIYDLRGRGETDRQKMLKLFAEYRINPDRILPAPAWKNDGGKIIMDFTEYDRAASFFFDTLKFNKAYSPQYFYLFGWANPPGNKFGEKPYDGESPYTGVDHSKLRPEFIKAYQSALRIYWDHLKAKGWADKVLLYVSDEPHALPEITAQMRALCDMIHEVDRKIPIYVSCWSYRPEFIGYIDVWGVSNHRGPAEDLITIKKTGDRLLYTTDGKMCTDTPYLGFERMLPYFCFKYGSEGYEFWGADWYTFDPYNYGWHRFNRESQVPGQYAWTRYPNGDGFLFYPGGPVGVSSLVPSLRLILIRQGVEDFEYMYYLNSLITIAKSDGKDISEAEMALETARGLVTIPSPEGRYSTKTLPDPYAVLPARAKVAEAIEGLL
jgi:hypothetical protein